MSANPAEPRSYTQPRGSGTSGGHRPGNHGGGGIIVFGIVIIGTIILFYNFDVLSEVLSVTKTTLYFIGGALAFIFSPITFYVTTFAIAAGDQNVPLYLPHDWSEQRHVLGFAA
jgi:hypothetical protein